MTEIGPDLSHLPPRERKLRMELRRQERHRKDAAEIAAKAVKAPMHPTPEETEATREAEEFAFNVAYAKDNLPMVSHRFPGGMRYALNEPDGPVRLQFHSDDVAGRFRNMETMTLEEAVRRKIM